MARVRRALARGLLLGGVLASLLALGPRPAAAQRWFGLGTAWDATLDLVGDFDRTTSEGPGSSRVSQRTAVREALHISRSRLWLLDPGLFTLNVAGTVGFRQGWSEPQAFDHAFLWGYNVGASVLPGRAYSLQLSATRTDTSLSRQFAGESDLRVETWGATLFAPGSPLPFQLDLRQEHFEEEARFAGQTTRRDEDRRILSFAGRRGWRDSEMELIYRYVDTTDRVTRAESSQTHDANARYALDFGEDLDWHWVARARGYAQTFDAGGRDLATLSITQDLAIEHAERLRTSYDYDFTYTSAGGGDTMSHRAGARLTHQYYESLDTSAGAHLTFLDFDAGETLSGGGHLAVVYRKRLPAGGLLQLTLGGSGIYNEDTRGEGEISVPNETHTAASPLARPIALGNPGVVAASIVVTKIGTGPLPLGCIAPPGPPTPLVEGRDYTVRAVGDTTELVPIPCAGAGPGINPGDTIAVRYRFVSAGDRAYLSTSWYAGISLGFGWVRVYARHGETEVVALSGSSEGLNGTRSDVVGLELRHDGPRLSARAVVEGERRTSEGAGLDIVELRSDQTVTADLVPGSLSGALSAYQVYTQYPEEGTASRTYGGRVSVSGRPASSVSVDASASYQWLRDTRGVDERRADARAGLRWHLYRLQVIPSVGLVLTERGESQTTELFAQLRITRRF